MAKPRLRKAKRFILEAEIDTMNFCCGVTELGSLHVRVYKPAWIDEDIGNGLYRNVPGYESEKGDSFTYKEVDEIENDYCLNGGPYMAITHTNSQKEVETHLKKLKFKCLANFKSGSTGNKLRLWFKAK